MSMFYVKSDQIAGEEANIIGEDVKHIRDVLRYKINDELNICNENGEKFITQIIDFSKEQVRLKVLRKCDETSEPSIKITLFQGMPKADKLEMIIQKCTELGVSEIVPVITERVIVKLEEKNVPKKVERWNRIALEASKQSGRQLIPNVKNPVNIKNIVENISKYDILILPYECEREKTLKEVIKNIDKDYKNIAVFIGPEGGFSEDEISMLNFENVKYVSLGKRILRTETAGMATIAMILYELDM